ncbi:hypothetical protein OIU83_22170, partial [Flavobacterium sp. LS1R49]|nr:hypothetical protein [Flavobacterium shii]
MQNFTYKKFLFLYSFILLFFVTFQIRAQFPFSESFTNSTAPNIQFGGSPPALLTGGAGLKNGYQDSEGNGFLRLTNNGIQQRGMVWSDLYAFPSAYGMTISFEYYSHTGNGSNGADGICFVLFDAAVPLVTSGAYGGSLGYAQQNGLNGFSGGYLGIGIDEYGNFAANSEGKSGGTAQVTSNSIVLRGKGSGTTDYPYLTSTQTTASPYLFSVPGKDRTATDNSKAGFRKIEIVLKPRAAGGFFIDVYLEHGNTKSLLINNYEYITEAPPMVKFAISSSTGGDNNFHEIRNLNLSVDQPTLFVPKAKSNAISGCAGLPATTSTDINTNNDGTVNVMAAINRESIDLDQDIPGIQSSKTVAGKGTFTYDYITGKVTFTPLNNSVEGPLTINYTFNDTYGKTSNVSAITYNSVVNRPPDVLESKIICSGDIYTWPVNGQSYSISGTYTKINDGCTANQVLELTATPRATDVITNGVTVCKGDTGSLSIATNNRPSISFDDTWYPLTDPKTFMPSRRSDNIPKCIFYDTKGASYRTITFSVNVTGTYTLKMTGLNTDYRAGYIYKGNYILGTCPEDGTWITGDDDYGVMGAKIPTLTAHLEIGTLYTLVSLVNAYESQDPLDYTWTLTPPDGGGFFLNPINAWYTAATGGAPIGWGTTFNPVGVPGSNLPNTSTAGSTTYYVGDITECTVRVPVIFKIKEDATVGASSSTPVVCINEILPSITHITLGITGIDSSINLPAGVTSSFSNNTITINGTPTVTGIFNYNINLIKDDNYCGTDTATGTITINDKPTAVTTTENICFGDSFVWDVDGQTYIASGTYTKNNNGCTADQVLELIVGAKPTTVTTTENICFGDSFVWDVDGQTYIASGTYTKN